MMIGMKARMDNAIHVQVQIIKLQSIWVFQARINSFSFLFNGVYHCFGVLVHQPPVKRRYTHLSLSLSLSLLWWVNVNVEYAERAQTTQLKTKMSMGLEKSKRVKYLGPKAHTLIFLFFSMRFAST